MLMDGGAPYNDYMNVRMTFDNISDQLLSNPIFVATLKAAIISILQEEYSKNIIATNTIHSQIQSALSLINNVQQMDATAIRIVRPLVSSHCTALDPNQFSPDFTHSYASTTTVDIQPARIIIQTIRKSKPQKNKPNEDFVRRKALYFNEEHLAIIEETVFPLNNSTISPSRKISKYNLKGNPIESTDVPSTDNKSR